MNQGKRSGHVIEVLCEIRFTGSQNFPTGVILPGVLFTQLSQNGTVARFDPLPQSAIPAQVRSLDANLRHLATHKMTGEHVVVGVGDLVVNLSQVDAYDGWPDMKALSENVFQKAISSQALGQIERASIKYVNLLPAENGTAQFGELNARIDIGALTLTSEPVTLRTELKFGRVSAVIQIVTQATLQVVPGTEHIVHDQIGRTGAVLEMDLIVNENFNDLSEIMDALEEAHALAKQLYLDIIPGGSHAHG